MEVEIRMKKFIAVLVTGLAISLVACSNNSSSIEGSVQSTQSEESNTEESSTEESVTEPESQEEIEYHKFGDTVSTDLIEFSLDRASVTIALENTYGEDYYTPKEYDPVTDANNPFVAKKGRTFAAYTCTITNLDRVSANCLPSVIIEYDGNEYRGCGYGTYYLYQARTYLDQYGKQHINAANAWYTDVASNLLLSAGEKRTIRAYTDMAVEVSDLTDDFIFKIELPCSDGTKTTFAYSVSD